VLSKRGWRNGTMNYPQLWSWKQGRLTNDQDGDREFLYLHFMRWKYDHYESNTPASGEGAWLELDRIIHVDWRHAVSDGFCVSPEGFTSITNET